ncbi:MAG: glutathione S-transferase [Proteobacteria bacterium]|nr:glutathione S-transferase [Pseudomonadota bacterium]
MKLYDAALSGNCHKVRMLLSMLALDHETVSVSLPALEQKTPAHLARNPLGTVPVLEDGGTAIYDSQAILVYLARKYGSERSDGPTGGQWLPTDATGLAKITQWLSFAANEIWNGPALARAVLLFKRDIDLAQAQASARNSFTFLDGWLAQHDWLALGRPTIADIACYPYAALAEAGGIPLAPYGALNAWFRRIEALPGYVGMPGLER